ASAGGGASCGCFLRTSEVPPMKPKTMILMVVAVGCGLGASYLTSKLLAERGQQGQDQTGDGLVAKKRLAPWVPIKDPENDFELKKFLADSAPKNVISDPAELKGQRLSKVLDEGKPVTKDDLLTREQLGLVAQMKPGQRAVAIKVNAESL